MRSEAGAGLFFAGLRSSRPRFCDGWRTPRTAPLSSSRRPTAAAAGASSSARRRPPLLSGFLLLNLHPSLLPRWRGAAPIARAIMAGDAETGVSVMRVTAGLDSGPVALQERTPIRPDEDWGSLSTRLAELGGELLVRALDLHEAGGLSFHEQDDSLATYAEKIAPEDRHLDPACPAAVMAEDGELGVGELEMADGELRLGCGDGVLRLAVVQPPGGRPMTVKEFLRGHDVPAAAR